MQSRARAARGGNLLSGYMPLWNPRIPLVNMQYLDPDTLVCYVPSGRVCSQASPGRRDSVFPPPEKGEVERETSEVRMKLRGLLTTATLFAMAAIPAMAQTSGGGPTESDMYCSGFVTKDAVPTNSKISAGWDAPNQVEFATGDFIYLKGGSY